MFIFVVGIAMVDRWSNVLVQKYLECLECLQTCIKLALVITLLSIWHNKQIKVLIHQVKYVNIQ